MNLERFVAVMRPRRSFEAVDLGFLITRCFWRRLIVAWLLPTLPMMALLAGLLPGLPFLGIPVFWWLKPLFERPLLFVLSRALFGEEPRWREVFAWRSIGPGLFADLTWRRLSPHRSLTMPVTLLEGSQGATGRTRRSLIGSADFTGGGLTYGCWLAELALFVAFFFFLEFLLPSGYTGFDGVDFENSEVWPTTLGLTFYFGYYLAATVLEPFYVGGGFLLYLQRRTVFEGWDVELAFRRLAQRRDKIAVESRRRDGGLAAVLLPGSLAILAGLLGLLGLFAAAPVVAWPAATPVGNASAQGSAEAATAMEADESSAQDGLAASGAAEEGTAEDGAAEEGAAAPRVPAPPEDIGAAIREVVASPDFGGYRDTERWRFKSGKPLFEPEAPVAPQWNLPWASLRWVLLALLVATLLFFLLRAWRDRVSFDAGGTPEKKKTEQRRFGLEEDPLAPIGDAAARARQALEAGRADEALAWLYRGAFQELAGRGLLPLRRDFTEDDCLRHLRRKAAGRSSDEAPAAQAFEELFREIAASWMRVAYGHFTVPKAEIARLCTAFDRVFKALEQAAA